MRNSHNSLYTQNKQVYYICMNTNLKQIYNLCPTLAYMDFDACHSALVRMCIAHQLNGGEFGGLYETALEYLMSIRWHKTA